MGMMGQTTTNYENEIEVTCNHPPECEGIVIQVVSTFTDKTSIDICGDEYYYDYLDNDSIQLIKDQIPEIQVIFFLSSSGLIKIDSSNNFGIFTFPYTTRDEGVCPNLQPGLIELIRDLNLFLDLNQTGDPQYEGYSGYVTLMDSYGTKCLDGSIDLCKIRINFMDMGAVSLFGFHRIDHYEFDKATCSIGDYLGHEDEHFDLRFGYSYECTGFSGFQQNDYSFDDFVEIVNKEFEGQKSDISLSSIDPTKIDYFPTISADYFTIKWGREMNINKTCLLINVSGEVVKKIENIKNTDCVTINIKDLTNGMYIVKVFNNITGNSSIGKIFKQ